MNYIKYKMHLFLPLNEFAIGEFAMVNIGGFNVNLAKKKT